MTREATARVATSLRPADTFALDFNATAARPRLVALVSPTCEVCLDGVRIVGEVIATREAGAIAVQFVWLPVLEADGEDAAEKAANEAVPGATHYWDGERRLSDEVGAVLELARLGRRRAWDLYLVYPPGLRITDGLPAPSSWLHQLRIEEVPELSSARLGGLLDELGR